VNVSKARDERYHFGDTELRRFLHDEIKLLTLQQRDAQI
jgi:hypothetical protein